MHSKIALRAILLSITLAFGLARSSASETDRNPTIRKLAPSSVQSYDYDSERSEFLILLMNGERLLMSKVPERVYESFNASDNKAAHFNRFIQPNFKGRKLKPRKEVRAKSKSHGPVGHCTRGMAYRLFNP